MFVISPVIHVPINSRKMKFKKDIKCVKRDQTNSFRFMRLYECDKRNLNFWSPKEKNKRNIRLNVKIQLRL